MSTQFHKVRRNKMIAGVCTGLAEHFNLNLFWTRFGFVALSLLGFGLPLIIYILVAILAPMR